MFFICNLKLLWTSLYLYNLCYTYPINTTVLSSAVFPIGTPLPLAYQVNAYQFITYPTSLNLAAYTENFMFQCQYYERLANIHIFWQINETSQLIIEGVSLSITSSSGLRNLTGRGYSSQLNSTRFRCEAKHQNGTVIDHSNTATILFQGPPQSVSNLQRDGKTIIWEAPFSLNLTNIEPDIVYCVEVYNITCGRSHVISDCDVMESRYTNDDLQSGYIYEYTITPRSNIRGALNGTKLEISETFMELQLPLMGRNFMINITDNNSSNVSVTAYLNIINVDTQGVVFASRHFLSLIPLDFVEENGSSLLVLTDTTRNGNSVKIETSLPFRRRFNCIVLAHGCDQHPVTETTEISTHDIQNISVTSTQPGSIRVTGGFIRGSSSIGALAIIIPLDTESNVIYIFHPRDSTTALRDEDISVPGGDYSVSLFIVEEVGLVFSRTALSPIGVSVNGGIKSSQAMINYNFKSISTGVCITCTFLESSTTDCVAVVHQRISQLNSSGLMNIESSHKFTRSGNTASGCIEGVNLEDYQIGVIGLRGIITSTRSITTIIAGISVAVIVVIALVIILLSVIVKKSWAKSNHSERKTALPNTYEPTPPTSSVISPLVRRVPSDGASGDIAIEMEASSRPPLPPTSTPAATSSTDVDDRGEVNRAVSLTPVRGVLSYEDTYIEIGTSCLPPPPTDSTLSALATTRSTNENERGQENASAPDVVAQAASISVADGDQVSPSDIKNNEDQYAVVNKPGKVPESNEATDENKKPLVYASLGVAPLAVPVPPTSDDPDAYFEVQLEEENGDKFAEAKNNKSSTSVDETVKENEDYPTTDMKPQAVHIQLNDDRVEYTEVTKTEGANGQQYEIVSHQKSAITRRPLADITNTTFVNSKCNHQRRPAEDQPDVLTSYSRRDCETIVVNKPGKVSESETSESSEATEGNKKPLVYASLDMVSPAVPVPPTSDDPVAYSKVQREEANRGQCAVAKKPEKSKSTSVTTNVDESGQLIISTPDEVPQATSISVAADDQDNTSDIKHEEVNGEQCAVVKKKVQESSDRNPIAVASTVKAPPTSDDHVVYSMVKFEKDNGDQHAEVKIKSTSVDETAKENKDTVIYSTPDMKPQAVSRIDGAIKMPECQSTPINDEKLHSGAIWHVQEPPFSPIDVNQSREDSIAAEQAENETENDQEQEAPDFGVRTELFKDDQDDDPDHESGYYTKDATEFKEIDLSQESSRFNVENVN